MCLPRLTLAQLRTLWSTTACTCHRDLEIPHRPMGKWLTCLPRLTLAQLRMLRSTTECTCCRDLEKFPSPPWETHVCSLFAGRRCLRLFRHGHDNVFLDHRQYSWWICACKTSHVQNFPSPRWECLADLPKSTLIFQLDRSLVLPGRCTLPATPANLPSPPWETHVWLVVCREAVSTSLPARSR